MSENFLRLIPADPLYVPTPAAQQQACSLLTSLLHKGDIQVKVTEEVSFIDPDSNLELILCPACEAVVPLEWWSSMMDRAYINSHFLDLTITMPCCATLASLNDLHYKWPAGFARFAIEVRSPGLDLTEQQLSLFKPILGCSVRKIWAHY